MSYTLTFAGLLAVKLMEFDYAGTHYSYHDRKLENAVKRLTAPGGPVPLKSGGKAATAELVVWGEAVNEWKSLRKL
jgi:hypothetical protein